LNENNALRVVAKEFKRRGIILESDQKLPNLVTLVTGERVKGSWWSHPESRAIWRILNSFSTRNDVLTTRLISGKITFIHRTLWPDFIAISTSKQDWQTVSLSPRAIALLKLVEKQGEIRTDSARWRIGQARSIADPARELERRLLVHSAEVHTAKGFHAKLLQSWERWSHEVAFTDSLPSAAIAKAKFEGLLQVLNEKSGANGRLPWTTQSANSAGRD
jgi:hypothetical protein